MSSLVLLESSTPTHPVVDADDQRLLALWLHGRSPHTQRAYEYDARRFLAAVGKPLATVRLGDAQAFGDALTGKQSSVEATINRVKSLLSFGHKIGMLPVNVGVAWKAPKSRDGLADRILPEADVLRMLALTNDRRDHALIRLLYATGARVAEIVGLRWSDVVGADDGTAFVTLFGKGAKTRTVRISAASAEVLRQLRGEAGDDAFVFAGRTGHLDAATVWRIVRAAARRAGITKSIGPHHLRHAHASHALDRGAKLTVIRDSLGHSSVAVTSRYLHARPEESSGLALAV